MPAMAAFPWTGDSPDCQLANPSAPMSVLSMRDSSSSPFNVATHPTDSIAEGLAPNYFDGGTENPHSRTGSIQDTCDEISYNALSHKEASKSPSRWQLLPQMGAFEASLNKSKTWSGMDEEHRDIATPGLSKGETHRVEPVSKTTASALPLMGYFSPQIPGKSSQGAENATAMGECLNLQKGADRTMACFSSSTNTPRSNLWNDKRKYPPYHGSDQVLSMPNLSISRANTLPATFTDFDACSISPDRCVELLESFPDEVLLLDIRPFAHFARANINDSLNLCIPTTLLKRRSFDTHKLEGTFTNEASKKRFSRWRSCRFIIVYDAFTSSVKDAGPLVNVLKKFTEDGWTGEGLIIRGGFKAFSEKFPGFVKQPQPQSQSRRATLKEQTSMNLTLPSIAPVVGGCAIPEESPAANPFFGNIRQNLDLIGGVGQIAVKCPEKLTESRRRRLPLWLRAATDFKDQGRTVSVKFLGLEKEELHRMRQALSYEPSMSSNASTRQFRVAGIEKGTKNRYNDVYPFEHSRVHLQDVPVGGCDYVNANYLKAEYSNKTYIATQAPVPDTFNDFWRVVWEQGINIIVSLTAEVERGQVKCHPYWESGDYGPLKLKCVSQQHIFINSGDVQHVDPRNRPVRDQSSLDGQNAFVQQPVDNSFIIVRHFSLSHSFFPFQPLREITQLQYPYWPDFGTTSQPFHLLKLIEQCDEVRRATSTVRLGDHESESGRQRPIIVHCSAGCGRTGAFCTVDSVLDMLKRQCAEGALRFRETDNEDPAGDGWIFDKGLDLIAKTVGDFRTQRPSMVQNLSQFVLCYESVLEWIASQMVEETAGTHVA
ncbi:hypothetical protein MAP00_000549 [Monascus purpureus]|nr:hypothetical protein MAP00_000549 [Monascus purpureus]